MFLENIFFLQSEKVVIKKKQKQIKKVVFGNERNEWKDLLKRNKKECCTFNQYLFNVFKFKKK